MFIFKCDPPPSLNHAPWNRQALDFSQFSVHILSIITLIVVGHW